MGGSRDIKKTLFYGKFFCAAISFFGNGPFFSNVNFVFGAVMFFPRSLLFSSMVLFFAALVELCVIPAIFKATYELARWRTSPDK